MREGLDRANASQANVELLKEENEGLRAEVKLRLESTDDLSRQLKDASNYANELEHAFNALNQFVVRSNSV